MAHILISIIIILLNIFVCNEVFPNYVLCYILGTTLSAFLGKLKRNHFQRFGFLQKCFRRYANCLNMVDTGYFRR